MSIKGERLELVAFSEKHLTNPDYFKWLRDYEVVKYLGRDEYLGQIKFPEVRTYVEDLWKNKYCSFFAIHVSESNTFIGTAKINFMDEIGFKTRTGDIGIMIGDRKYWGKGLATDTLKTICGYAFNKMNARKLIAGAVSENSAVVKAFKRIGFKEEACLRKKILIEGNYFDHILLGCFENEFHSNQATY